jgi:hemerythrin-like domain-containing protein
MQPRGRAGHAESVAQADDFTSKHDEFRAWTDELRAAARLLPSLDKAARFAVVADLVAFLQEKVEPHTHVDEQVLYPQAATRGGSPLAAAAMAYDHLAIRSWIAKLAEADEEDIPTLQELLYGLDALIRVHLWKEDELFVKPLSSSTWPASGA